MSAGYASSVWVHLTQKEVLGSLRAYASGWENMTIRIVKCWLLGLAPPLLPSIPIAFNARGLLGQQRSKGFCLMSPLSRPGTWSDCWLVNFEELEGRQGLFTKNYEFRPDFVFFEVLAGKRVTNT